MDGNDAPTSDTAPLTDEGEVILTAVLDALQQGGPDAVERLAAHLEANPDAVGEMLAAEPLDLTDDADSDTALAPTSPEGDE